MPKPFWDRRRTIEDLVTRIGTSPLLPGMIMRRQGRMREKESPKGKVLVVGPCQNESLILCSLRRRVSGDVNVGSRNNSDAEELMESGKPSSSSKMLPLTPHLIEDDEEPFTGKGKGTAASRSRRKSNPTARAPSTSDSSERSPRGSAMDISPKR